MLKLISISFLFSSLAMAAPDTKLISASGTCLKSVFPDRGSVSLVAEFQAAKASEASAKTAKLYEKIREKVKALRLKDYEASTSEYNVSEVSDYPNGKKVSRGFRASMGLRVVTSEITRLGDVIAVASELDVNRVENLSTFISPALYKKEHEACLQEAIKNARSKAELMAKAGNVKVGEVLLIYENAASAGHPVPMVGMAKAEMASDSRSFIAPSVETKAEDVAVSVNVQFAIK